MGNESSKSKGHTLGGSSNPSQPSKPAPKQTLLPKPTSQPSRGTGTAVSANSEDDRANRLAAVEARLGASEKRGVQKGGGKLAQKLEETKKNPNAAVSASDAAGGSNVADYIN
ncbi:hypothetical protein HDU80_006551 [Chytriomyces hyalinus]|nr:hypothetical protein HDU80_006551 [Chytriomyces hyalinus]